jgi:hypothetical protein
MCQVLPQCGPKLADVVASRLLAGRGVAGPDLREYRFADQERASRPELAGASNSSRMSREVLIHLSVEMRLIGVVSEVAADEVAPELVRGVHDDEAASRRVYDKITRPSNGIDELSDEADRLDVGVKFAVDFFRPSVRNAVIAPRDLGALRRPLQHGQIITAPPRPVAVTDTFIVPAMRWGVLGLARGDPTANGREPPHLH